MPDAAAVERCQLRFGAFSLDPDVRQLTGPDGAVPLTPKTFDLLVLLVENRHRLVEKDELMQRLWPDTVVEESNLSQNVFTLRKALGERQDGQRFIATVPKRGYRFVAPVAVEMTSGRETRKTRGPLTRWTLGASVALVAAAVAFVAGRAVGRARGDRGLARPAFRQLTFRRGYVHDARFAADGRTVIYSAAWDAEPITLYTTRTDSPESRRLDGPPAGIMSVSRHAELALATDCSYVVAHAECEGTLARAPLTGGSPRELVTRVVSADWTPDGKELAVIRAVDRGWQLEFPLGAVTRRGPGEMAHVRVAPDGRTAAYVQYAPAGSRGLSGAIELIDRLGRAHELTTGLRTVTGLAWTPRGDEIWYSGGNAGPPYSLFAVDMKGRVQVVERGGHIRLFDIASDGRALVSRPMSRMETFVRERGVDRNVSWFDGTVIDALSEDGKTMLFTERGAAGTDISYALFTRSTAGAAPVRLGDGYGLAISPDGKWALAKSRPASGFGSLTLLPFGAGASRVLERGSLVQHQFASFLPDNSAVVFAAQESAGAFRTYFQSVAGGPPRLLTHDEGSIASPLAPDGRSFISAHADGTSWRTTIDPGLAHRVPLQPGERSIQWTDDGSAVYVVTPNGARFDIARIDLATSRRAAIESVGVSDVAGFVRFFGSGPFMSSDRRVILYSVYRIVSDLFLAEALDPRASTR